jgi:ABC-type antimicrobial peptide transport system permease subunit
MGLTIERKAILTNISRLPQKVHVVIKTHPNKTLLYSHNIAHLSFLDILLSIPNKLLAIIIKICMYTNMLSSIEKNVYVSILVNNKVYQFFEKASCYLQ